MDVTVPSGPGSEWCDHSWWRTRHGGTEHSAACNPQTTASGLDPGNRHGDFGALAWAFPGLPVFAALRRGGFHDCNHQAARDDGAAFPVVLVHVARAVAVRPHRPDCRGGRAAGFAATPPPFATETRGDLLRQQPLAAWQSTAQPQAVIITRAQIPTS